MISIQADKRVSRWGLAFKGMPATMIPFAEIEWNTVTDEFLTATQSFAHTITFDMKSTGRSDVQVADLQVVGTVTYGGVVDGVEVDYAEFEHARGGDHAYLDRGWEMVADRYPDALARAWTIAVRAWK